MSRRESGYVRQTRELYETPAWVTQAALPHIPRTVRTWLEPACGSGKMVDELRRHGFAVLPGDIALGRNFFDVTANKLEVIGTNPPFNLATEFIEHALHLQWPIGIVIMLLPCDFDSAITRKHLFGNHPAFCKTVVLRKRIKWFDEPPPCYQCKGTGGDNSGFTCTRCKGKGTKASGPSENHNWFIWDWQHKGPSTKAYGP